jgi:Fic family protein
MQALNLHLAKSRADSGKTVRNIAQATGIDAALISKYENGSRLPTLENLKALSAALQVSFDTLKKLWLAEKVYQLLEQEENAMEVLEVAESRIEYLLSHQVLKLNSLSIEVQQKLQQIDHLKSRWLEKKPLNIGQLSKMQEYFHLAYTYESNRIEGNTLSLQETHLVIHEGLTIGGKSMKEHLEAINHAEAVAYLSQLVQQKAVFTPKVLLELHYLVLHGNDKENAGKYRQMPVRISGSAHIPPQPYLVPKMMEDYFMHYDGQRKLLHPIILAAEMHERLVSIHPFIDGNGRTSRLVMNLILLQHGYTLANLKGDHSSRLNYYRALEGVQVHNDPEVFYHLVADAVLESLQQHLEMV